MELIDKYDLMRKVVDYFQTHSYARTDTRIFGEVIDLMQKQESLVSLDYNPNFRAILAPCPKCGSFNVGVYTDKIGDEDYYYPHYKGHFKCFDCNEDYFIHATEMPAIFMEWNLHYISTQKQKR